MAITRFRARLALLDAAGARIHLVDADGNRAISWDALGEDLVSGDLSDTDQPDLTRYIIQSDGRGNVHRYTREGTGP